MLDIAVLVAFEPIRENWVDPTTRAAFASTQSTAVRARHRALELLGVTPSGEGTRSHRSLTAVALATSLERAALRWRVLDPGVLTVREWRQRIEELRADPPRVVAISSTFVVSGTWLGNLCAVVRRFLPKAKIVVGGYYYATDAKLFLSMDADVLCVGEGERRIVQIVEAIRDGSSLDEIPGLYVRGPDKRLRHTGDAEPLNLEELPLPDWSLSTRIDPPVDPEREPLEYNIETQRGCVFKCEYCTFRTIAAPVTGSVDLAIRAIKNVAPYRGRIFIVDPTGTFPRDRFRRILERLIEEGGSALPISLYARVSDLNDEVCALMAKAGITTVAVGQESGDQGILNAMKKGTKVEQVKPAIDTLARHGLNANFFFMFGFPGETIESMAATRRLVCAINDGHEKSPVVHMASLSVTDIQDFAAVSRRDAVKDVSRRFAYDHLAVTPARAAEEKLVTLIEMARVPHAPATGFGAPGPLWSLFDERHLERDQLAFFRWMKALDRVIGIFAEEDVDGKRPRRGELDRLRRQILDHVTPRYRGGSRVARAGMRLQHRLAWFALDHWKKHGAEMDLFTRSAIAWEVGRSTGSLHDASLAFRAGKPPPLGIVTASEPEAPAARLIDLAVATGRRRLERLDRAPAAAESRTVSRRLRTVAG